MDKFIVGICWGGVFLLAVMGIGDARISTSLNVFVV